MIRIAPIKLQRTGLRKHAIARFGQRFVLLVRTVITKVTTANGHNQHQSYPPRHSSISEHCSSFSHRSCYGYSNIASTIPHTDSWYVPVRKGHRLTFYPRSRRLQQPAQRSLPAIFLGCLTCIVILPIIVPAPSSSGSSHVMKSTVSYQMPFHTAIGYVMGGRRSQGGLCLREIQTTVTLQKEGVKSPTQELGISYDPDHDS